MNESTFVLGPFLGRFHPLLVHLPIGFLVLLALLEFMSLRPSFKHLATACRPILVASVMAVFGAAISGWLLGEAGDYGKDLLFQHRWSGIALTACVLALYILHQRHQLAWYRRLLLVMVVLVGVTGHLGGALTHGSDYLAKYAPGPLKGLLGGRPSGATGSSGNSAFELAVQPVLNRTCVSCHGPEKSKADFRVDSHPLLMKGSENGAVIVPGNASESEIIKRVSLPMDHDDHMPPDGKPQPTTDELALLSWWVDAGAPADKTVAELNPPEDILRLIGAGKGGRP